MLWSSSAASSASSPEQENPVEVARLSEPRLFGVARGMRDSDEPVSGPWHLEPPDLIYDDRTHAAVLAHNGLDLRSERITCGRPTRQGHEFHRIFLGDKQMGRSGGRQHEGEFRFVAACPFDCRDAHRTEGAILTADVVTPPDDRLSVGQRGLLFVSQQLRAEAVDGVEHVNLWLPVP